MRNTSIVLVLQDKGLAVCHRLAVCTMITLKFIFIVAVTLGSAYGQTDCSSLPDGHYAIGCKVYDVCTNHILTTVECQQHHVYDHAHMHCRPQTHVGPPCGLVKDCSHLSDGSYVELLLNCTSYYTCHHHTYFGHNFCTPGTVFEQSLQTCVWPEDAYPPCGTKTV